MTKKVILTPIALDEYQNIIEYLLNKWGTKVTSKFINRFEIISELFVEHPQIFPFVHKEKQIQKCVLTKHNVIYFKNTPETIRVLRVFDTRQNPEKLLSLF